MAIDLLENLYAFAVARAPRPLVPILRPKFLMMNRKRMREDVERRRRTVAQQGRDVAPAHFSWYRGEHTNYNPTKVNLFEHGAIDEYILKGWLPKEPFVTSATPIVAFGSCFAAHISHYLRERGYNVMGKGMKRDVYVIRFGEGMVNSFAIRQQFEWAFEGRQFKEGLWRDKSGTLVRPEQEVRKDTLAIFQSADLFILTFGLSEVWYDKATGDVFWRAVPADAFDPQRHGFRISTVEENLANLKAIVGLIGRHRPDANIVVTLSPVPLIATFRPVSCVSANSVSKSVLRVAIDELMRSGIGSEKLFYFPSYEIVTSYFRNPFGLDNRHVRPEVVDTIMAAFGRHYLVPDTASQP